MGGLGALVPERGEWRGGRVRPVKGKETVILSTPPLSQDIREKTLEAWVWFEKFPEKPVTVLEIKNQSGYRGAALDGIHYAAAKKKQWENASTAQFRTADTGGSKESGSGGELIQIAIVYAADDTIRIYRNGKPYGKPYKPEIETAVGHLQACGRGDAIVRFIASQGVELDEARLYDVALSEEQVESSFAAGAPRRTSEQLAHSMTPAPRDRVEAPQQEPQKRKARVKAITEIE